MTIEELFKKYGIKSIEELDRILANFANRLPDILNFIVIIDAYGEYCKSIGKDAESREFIQATMKKLAERGETENGQQ